MTVVHYCFLVRALIAGGGAPEIEVSIKLAEHARTLTGMEAYCVRAFAESLEIIPYTLSENAGLNPIATVTELRNRHAQGETTAGINVRKVGFLTSALDALHKCSIALVLIFVFLNCTMCHSCICCMKHCAQQYGRKKLSDIS